MMTNTTREHAPRRWRRPAAVASLAVALLLAGIASPAVGAEDRSPPGFDELPDTYRTSIELIANQEGISIEQAWSNLETQNELDDWARTIETEDGYAGFQFETDAEGNLQGVAAFAGDQPDSIPDQVRTVESTLSKKQADLLTARLMKNSDDGATYDPFTDTLTAWTAPETDVWLGGKTGRHGVDAGDTSRAWAALVPDGITIETQPGETVELTRGGNNVSRGPDNNGAYDLCTTAFGVTRNFRGRQHRAVLTAGHCWLGGQGNAQYRTPNNRVRTVRWADFAKMGGYLDRVFYQVRNDADIDWFVQVNPGVFEDMSSNPVHLRKGGRYCHYGRTTAAQQCDELARVNSVRWVEDDGQWYKMFYFVNGVNGTSLCQGGDSGGPVWAPGRESRPAGLISAGASSQGFHFCYYVSVDDQLAGTGYSLL